MAYWDYLLLASALLFIVTLGLSIRFREEHSYLVADRNVGFFALTATLVMTEFNTATLLSFASIGYIAGFWGLVMPFIFLFGLLFYGITVAKKWKAFDGTSVAGFFTKRYGKSFGKCVSGVLLLAMGAFSATYVKSLTLIFSPLFNLSEWQLSGLFVILALLVSFRGGLRSIIYTDTLAFLMTLLFFPLMLYYSWNSNALSPLPPIEIDVITPSFVFSLILITMFTYILAPWYGQKLFSARSEKVAFISVIAAALLVFFLYVFAIIPAVFLHLNGTSIAHPEQALPYVIHNLLPTGLRGLGYTILLLASLTTLTGVWNAMAAMGVSDFQFNRTWVLTTLFALLSFILSVVFVDHIFSKLILANIPIAALSFALLGGFYWKKTSRSGALISILVGLSWGIGVYLYFGEEGEYTWYWAVIGIPLIFMSGVLGSICFPEKSHVQSLLEL